MSEEKTDAIVIRSVDFSETSSIVTFFTRDFGKVSALAKGARRKKGPFESALDLLATCRIVFLHKSGDVLDLLTEAKLQNRLRATELDISRLYASYYIAELLQSMTDEFDPHPDLYQTTIDTIRRIETPDVRYEPLILRYELNILRETGQLPSFSKCVGCGKAVSSTPRVAFGLLAGGVVCNDCRHGHRRIVSIRKEVLSILRQFADPDGQSWRTDNSYVTHEKEIRPIMNQYIVELLGRRPKLQGYIPILGKS